MSITVQCGCGKTTHVPDEFAGRRGKCRACGAVVRIPIPEAVPVAVAGTVPFDDATVPVRAPGPAPADVWPVEDLPAFGKAPRPVPHAPAGPEPWFYGHLWRYATVLKWSALVVVWVGLILLVLVSLFLINLRGPAPELLGGKVLGLLVLWGVGLPVVLLYRFFALVRSASIYLRVDEARNIRRTRIRAEGEAG
jgi:hypothetical protein